MPYATRAELPKGVVKNLPPHAAQDIYKEAFNAALEQYSNQQDTEETAHRVAWSAVKSSYEKHGDAWHKK